MNDLNWMKIKPPRIGEKTECVRNGGKKQEYYLHEKIKQTRKYKISQYGRNICWKNVFVCFNREKIFILFFCKKNLDEKKLKLKYLS